MFRSYGAVKQFGDDFYKHYVPKGLSKAKTLVTMSPLRPNT